MTTRHTPGPWYIGKDFSDQGRHIYAAQKVRHEDGDEWHPLIASTDDDERLIDWQANARLIAAAPDLLEALKEIAADYADRFDLDDPSTNPGIKYTIKQARAAIAKATGETK